MPRALLAGLYAAYALTRVAIDVQVAEARERGLGILALEQAVHVDIELAMNQVVAALPALGLVFSYLYATLHYLVTPAVLAWIFVRRRAQYALARNAPRPSYGVEPAPRGLSPSHLISCSSRRATEAWSNCRRHVRAVCRRAHTGDVGRVHLIARAPCTLAGTSSVT